jgi:hypothetical protein
MMVRTLTKDATAEDMAALLEDIDKELLERTSLNKQSEELKQVEVRMLQ